MASGLKCSGRFQGKGNCCDAFQEDESCCEVGLEVVRGVSCSDAFQNAENCWEEFQDEENCCEVGLEAPRGVEEGLDSGAERDQQPFRSTSSKILFRFLRRPVGLKARLV
mmetsp:Transcript_112449/g.183323  ORF Transcript_112449/g.183323 Transcript_112449/m.183323 type:complete len:110 (+) Transcript_112449:53-382(+)